MSDGPIVTARCVLCHQKGVDNLRFSNGNGKVFWSNGAKKYTEIAKSQRSSDSPPSADPLSHIAWVASCGCSAH